VGTYVALLRGINVGGKNLVAMAPLRDVFEGLAFGDVRTYIQSGNVIFSAPVRPKPEVLQAAVTDRFGVSPIVVLRTPAELTRAMAANPFAKADPSGLYIGFLSKTPAKAAVTSLDHERFSPDQFAVIGKEVFFHLPKSMARTKVPDYLNRRLGVAMTIRNQKSLAALIERCGS
jgi:uncharacterized protein (DUF1697 family)